MSFLSKLRLLLRGEPLHMADATAEDHSTSMLSPPEPTRDYRDTGLVIQDAPSRAWELNAAPVARDDSRQGAYCSGMGGGPIMSGQWFVCRSGQYLGYDTSTGRFLTNTGQVVLPDTLLGMSARERRELYNFFNIGGNQMIVTGMWSPLTSGLD